MRWIDFDRVDARRTPRRRRSSDLVWNVLAAILLVMTLCVVLDRSDHLCEPEQRVESFPAAHAGPHLRHCPTATSTLRMTLEPSWTPTRGIPTAHGDPGADQHPPGDRHPG